MIFLLIIFIICYFIISYKFFDEVNKGNIESWNRMEKFYVKVGLKKDKKSKK